MNYFNNINSTLNKNDKRFERTTFLPTRRRKSR